MARTLAARLRAFAARQQVRLYSLAVALLPLRRDTVLLQAHTGESLFGNPFYIARHLANADDGARRIRCVSAQWPADLRRLGIAPKRAKGLPPGGLRHALALATAGHLVCDTSFPPWFTRRPGQRYLNTWHGTPLKALGSAVPCTLHANLRNMQRNFLQADCILAPNAHTQAVFERDFGLASLWSGTYLRCGYPRNDAFAAGTGTNANGRAQSAIGGRRNALDVAYMPTWRGTHGTLDASTRQHVADVERFLAVFSRHAPASATLWVKLHPLMKGALDLSGHPRVREFPADLEAYEHLARCGTLVTDYSSVMVDFAAGGGRVLLYAPDLEDYARQQDFSIAPSQLPYPIFATAEAVVAALEPARDEPRATNALLDSLLEREHGDSTRLLCEWLFDGQGPGIAVPGARLQPLRTLVLVEERLDPDSAAQLEAATGMLDGAGLSVTISTPGEAGEDPLLVGLAKRNPQIAYCPSTSARRYGARTLPGIPAVPESRRLYGDATFCLVLMAGRCRYYRRLLAGFPVERRLTLDLHDAALIDTLRARLANSPPIHQERPDP